jgi:ATP-binding cassette subfamily B protein
LRARWAAMRNIAPFLKLVWAASPGFTAASLILRVARSVLPIAALWTGKLIIDQVVHLSGLPDHPTSALGWWNSGHLGLLTGLVALEFGLAILSDLLGRVVGLVDSLLSDRLTMQSSIRLMEHAATLDLETFEDAGFQDKLERARR